LTMLAAVRERQREIGVFRALGFRTRDVVSLMFRESLLLSVVAAVVGVTLGVLGAAFGPKIVPSLDLQLAVSIPVLIGGAALAIVLAAVATVYPAFLATRLDPAIALRKL
jgi:putative ABC transport system permease protein